MKNAPQNSEASPESLVIVTTHGSFPLGGHKWHGASASADGTIVSVPANADNVLCIVPSLKSAYTVSSGQSTSLPSTTTIPEPTLYILEGETPGDIATGRHRTDNKYKYLGAMKGPDGNVYCFPSGSERVLQIDTVKRVARSVGPNLRDNNMENLFQNKVSMRFERGIFCSCYHDEKYYELLPGMERNSNFNRSFALAIKKFCEQIVFIFVEIMESHISGKMGLQHTKKGVSTQYP